jgi:hypothetical protein
MPTLNGTPEEGDTLTASASAGQSDKTVSYVWYSSADNYTNAIGTGATYQVKEGDEGNQIEVKATAINDSGATVSATNAPTATVADAAPTITTPVIAGTAQEGQTLAASANAGQGAPDIGEGRGCVTDVPRLVRSARFSHLHDDQPASAHPAGCHPCPPRFGVGSAFFNRAELASSWAPWSFWANSALATATFCSVSARAVFAPRTWAISS